jgi:serine/threonine protein kinase
VPPAANAAIEVGSAANRYHVLTRLAAGGMAEIFLARRAADTGVERYCVLKRILPEHARDAHFVQMFLDEARLSTLLQHPNIASVYDIGRLDDSYFYTMEYVHGDTIQSLLRRAQMLRRPLPLACVLTIIAGAAAGLHHAHERTGNDGLPLGIVHRDVSPSNVMVSYEGNVKLVDFGVAKASNRVVETASGTVKGKISYLSPEQCRCAAVDRRSDLFSLGIVAWEMLTGGRLYQGPSDFETMLAIVEESPPAPSTLRAEVPPAIDDLVLRLLAKSVVDRFQTAAEVVEAIENAAFGTGTMLSSVAVSRLMLDLFGPRAEPWRDFGGEAHHGDTVTLIWHPIDDGVDSAEAQAPAPPSNGPATASMEVSASVAIHLAAAPEAREPPAVPPRAITARAVLVSAAAVVIAVATWRIAPWLRGEPGPNRGAQLDVPVVDPSSGPSSRPRGDLDSEREATGAVPRSAAAQPEVAPAKLTALSLDRAAGTAAAPRRASSAKPAVTTHAASRVAVPGAPASSGHGKPSVESVRRAFEARDYAGVVAACHAATMTSAIAELCTRSACQQQDMANAQRWLPSNSPRLIDKLVADCSALGNKLLRTPALDCSNDPLDCR